MDKPSGDTTEPLEPFILPDGLVSNNGIAGSSVFTFNIAFGVVLLRSRYKALPDCPRKVSVEMTLLAIFVTASPLVSSILTVNDPFDVTRSSLLLVKNKSFTALL